jgi:dihydroflavonol-4-reductase
VLVTGASGFLAIHCVAQLLEQGYNVRGTLRSLAREEEVRAAVRKYVNADDRLSFVTVDLLQDAGWQDAVRGCEYVFHVASPFPLFEPENENDLIQPAVEGTLRVLRAAHKARVKRVVLVSSNAAISAGYVGENRVFTEADWSRLDRPIGAYAKSKTLAERAAWNFINSPENINKLELVSINPSLILGPVPNKVLPTSAEMIKTYMKGEVPGVAWIKMGIVDVRDVASAMVLAMTTPEAAGERFLCSGATPWIKEIADVLGRHFSNTAYKIPRILVPSFLVRILALFDKKIARVLEGLDWEYELSNEKAKRVLHWQPRSKEEAILSMAESLIELGFV